MITATRESIITTVKALGEACLAGEQEALGGHSIFISPARYENKDEQDAYLIGMRRQQEIMRGEA